MAQTRSQSYVSKKMTKGGRGGGKIGVGKKILVGLK